MVTSIVVGVWNGKLEVLPAQEFAPPVDKSKLERFYHRISENEALCFRDADNARSTVEELASSGHLDIEVFGAREEACLMCVIIDSVAAGLNVRVPKGFTFKHPFIGGYLNDQVQNRMYRTKVEYVFSEDSYFMFFSPKE